MTPEERAKLEQTYDWMIARQAQLIPQDVDDGSRLNLRALTLGGTSALTPTQNVNINSTPTSISVARPPTGFKVMKTPDGDFTFAYYT